MTPGPPAGQPAPPPEAPEAALGPHPVDSPKGPQTEAPRDATALPPCCHPMSCVRANWSAPHVRVPRPDPRLGPRKPGNGTKQKGARGSVPSRPRDSPHRAAPRVPPGRRHCPRPRPHPRGAPCDRGTHAGWPPHRPAGPPRSRRVTEDGGARGPHTNLGATASAWLRIRLGGPRPLRIYTAARGPGGGARGCAGGRAGQRRPPARPSGAATAGRAEEEAPADTSAPRPERGGASRRGGAKERAGPRGGAGPRPSRILRPNAAALAAVRARPRPGAAAMDPPTSRGSALARRGASCSAGFPPRGPLAARVPRPPAVGWCPAAPRLPASWCVRAPERETGHVHSCTDRPGRRYAAHAWALGKLRQRP